uniref:Uncharacterized protein n=1 Tax=Prolemur simus TaxID=1328070 RepID=A0A8C8YKH5_PROSS
MWRGLEKAKQFKRVVFVTKARPRLASAQTRQAAAGSIFLDDLGCGLKKNPDSDSSCTADKHIRD